MDRGARERQGLLLGRDITTEKEQAEARAGPEDALRQAQKMEAVGQLTGGIAHDFNNLLAGDQRQPGAAADAAGAGPARRGSSATSATAQGAAKRAAALTQRLLAFSRRQTLDPRPTDVNRLIAGMEDLIRRTVGPDRRARGGRRRRPVADPGRPDPARERAAQPVHQRARRDARRRQADHRDRQPVARRARGARARSAARPVRLRSASPTPAPA